MTGLSQEDPERHARWEEAWRRAVRTAPMPLILMELANITFLELSAPAADLLGTTPDEGRGTSYIDTAERPEEAELTVRLGQQGLLDGVRSRRAFRRADGRVLQLQSTSWVIRSPAGRHLVLWALTEAPSGSDAATAAEITVPDDRSASTGPSPALPDQAGSGELDEDWRVVRISPDAARWFGWPPAELVGRRLPELVHPGDVDVLLLAMARATTDSEASVHLRPGRTTGAGVVRTILALDAETGTYRFAFAAYRSAEADRRARTEKLAGHLRRIAAEVEAAEVLDAGGSTVDEGFASSVGLSGRQWEILNRLARGERVALIASEMYLSRSTVRNHLTAIFRKVGVHSQQELISLLRQRGGPV